MQIEQCSGAIITIPWKRHKIDALYYHLLTHEEHFERRPVILRLHGLLGNLLDDTEHFLPQELARHGYSSLTMNTLLANLGLFFGFGIFEDTVSQIDAVFEFLAEVGVKSVVISGHGLGGCMAIRYGAARCARGDDTPGPALSGVIAIATPSSYPDTIRRRWDTYGSDPTYEQIAERAGKLFSPVPGETPISDETIVIKRAHGPTMKPEHTEIYTLKTWWALAGPQADGSRTIRHIRGISVPLLLINGTKDDRVLPEEADHLAGLVRDAGNPDVTVVSLDANHTFLGQHGALGRTIVDWLDARFGKDDA